MNAGERSSCTQRMTNAQSSRHQNDDQSAVLSGDNRRVATLERA